MSKVYRVSVVLDREYGERLPELNLSRPVWIVDTPVNRTAAQKIWTQEPSRDHLEGVTTFKIDINDSPEDNLVDEMDTIDLHHGIYSSDPAYTVLEVLGVLPTEKIKAKLSRYGFDEFKATKRGFVATRPLPKSGDD